MDTMTAPGVWKVVIMWSTQTGKTEVGILNPIAFFIDQDPSPIIAARPTIKMGDTFSKDRLAPMLRDTPVLAAVVSDAKSRDSSNTLSHKNFPGGHLTIVGANSPASLADRPARVVLIDEKDRFPKSAGTEGDPCALLIKRTKNFPNRLIVEVSSPTSSGSGTISESYGESDQRHYHVPCTECGELHVLKWENVHWAEDDPGHVWMVCPNCDSILMESDKHGMIKHGKWIADEEFKGIAGFHINELYSPWVPWADVVDDYLKAEAAGPYKLQVWWNTSMAETYEDTGEVPDDKSLYSRREHYLAEVPNEAMVLTCGVDTQDNRLEASVYGWGDGGLESYAIGHKVFSGDPADPDVWRVLDELLGEQFTREDGLRLPIACTFIDSGGHRTQSVYRFVQRRQSRNIFAIIGRGGEGIPIAKKPTAKGIGSTAANPVMLWTVGVDQVNSILHSRLLQEERGPGYCHYPAADEFTEEYFAQLVGMGKSTRQTKGVEIPYWEATRRDVEARDCFNYAFAAMISLNVNWAAVKANQAPTEESAQAPKAKVRQHKKGGYVNRYGRR